MSKKRNARRRTRNVLLIVSMMLVVAMASVGVTVAWLTDKTDPVVNTFTGSDVDITLAEATRSPYKMVPGVDIAKDPKVTVLADSEACWLFVKIEKANNFDNFMTFAPATGWTALPNVSGVYYRAVGDTDADQPFDVLDGNKVSVKNTVTKQMMDDLTEATQPKLTFTAYAIQTAGFEEVADAWAEISNPTAANE